MTWIELVLVGEGHRPHLHLERGAVLAQELLLGEGESLAAGQDSLHTFRHQGPRAGMNEVESGPAQDLLRPVVPQEPRPRLAAEHEAALAEDGDGVGGQLDQPAVALFAFPEGLVGPLAFGHVADHAPEALGLAGRVADQGHRGLDDAPGPVLAQDLPVQEAGWIR